jgi:hypothetical protein
VAILDIRPECERCGKALPNGAPDARICTFECTYCTICTDGELAGICPNCGGDLQARPTRPAKLMEKFPIKEAPEHHRFVAHSAGQHASTP